MVSLFFILLFGINGVGSIDFNKKELIIDVYIFNSFLILKFVVFECNGAFYYQINRSNIKAFVKKEKGTTAFNLELPKIKVKKVYINLSYPIDSATNNILIVGVLKTILDMIVSIMYKYVKIEDYRFNSFPLVSANHTFNFQFKIGLSVYKIIYYLLINKIYGDKKEWTKS